MSRYKHVIFCTRQKSVDMDHKYAFFVQKYTFKYLNCKVKAGKIIKLCQK